MLERRAQPIRTEIPYAYVTICPASDDCARASQSGRGARAIGSADDIDEDDSFDTLITRMAAEGGDNLPLAKAATGGPNK